MWTLSHKQNKQTKMYGAETSAWVSIPTLEQRTEKWGEPEWVGVALWRNDPEWTTKGNNFSL